MTEREYRELFTALRLRPKWAQYALEYVRRQPGYDPDALTVLDLRRRGMTYREIAEDFGVCRERARMLCREALYREELKARMPPPEGHGLTEAQLLEQSVEDFDFDIRAMKAFRFHGITRMAELVALSEYDILRFKNLGRKTPKSIKEVLAVYGLVLASRAIPTWEPAV
jgi:DNA-directed RNA polymerase alpha subunit